MVDDTPTHVSTSPDILRLQKFGTSIGVVLPMELLIRLGWNDGDFIDVAELPEGGLRLTAQTNKRATALDLARSAFREYADTYRELAGDKVMGHGRPDPAAP